MIPSDWIMGNACWIMISAKAARQNAAPNRKLAENSIKWPSAVLPEVLLQLRGVQAIRNVHLGN